MNQVKIEQIRNIARLIVADANEELERLHSDEAECEVEVIQVLREKAQSIISLADELLGPVA